MKRFMAVITFVALLGVVWGESITVLDATGSMYMDTKGWSLIEAASDEFNGTSLDATKWNNGIWYDVSTDLAFKDSNVTVSDGNLELHARVENHNGKAYTIGSVESKFEVPGVNSYVEVRAKLLDSRANVLSAIWMQSSPLTNASNPNPEIDIHESFDYFSYEQALHTWKISPDFHWRHGHHVWSTGVDMSQDYHVYGLEREGKTLRFYFDGQLAWETTQSEESFAEMSRHLVLSLEGHLGKPNSQFLPSKFMIDYVRTYYRNDLTLGPNNGTYKIVNRKSGLALNVPSASLTNGTQLIQWPYEGGNHEKWSIRQNPDLTYTIENVNSGKVIDVHEGKTGNGEQIIQFNDTGNINQKWIIEPLENGFYRILSLKTGKALAVLDASNNQGANIVQWSYGTAMNDQWEIIQE